MGRPSDQGLQIGQVPLTVPLSVAPRMQDWLGRLIACHQSTPAHDMKSVIVSGGPLAIPFPSGQDHGFSGLARSLRLGRRALDTNSAMSGPKSLQISIATLGWAINTFQAPCSHWKHVPSFKSNIRQSGLNIQVCFPAVLPSFGPGSFDIFTCILAG